MAKKLRTGKAISSPELDDKPFWEAAIRLAVRRPLLLLLPASMVIGYVCVHEILTSAGRPAAPIDDAYIHLQFVRRMAGGNFFSYVSGEGRTTGATSPGWCVALMPFYWLGMRGLSLLWATWIIGSLAHAGVAAETMRVVRRLAGDKAAIGSALACLGFGAYAWHAWSGMETMAFAWILLATARRAGAWCEPCEPGAPKAGDQLALIACALVAPLVRPEGVIATLIAAIALCSRPRSTALTLRCALAGLALVGPLIVPCMNAAFVGRTTPSTAIVKFLPLNPYLTINEVTSKTLENAWNFVTTVLNGGSGSAFLPYGSALFALAGVVACARLLLRKRLLFHGLFLGLVLLGVAIPCSYLGFDTNRARYLWPFASVLFVGLGCLIGEVGDWLGSNHPGLERHATYWVGLALACPLWLCLPTTISDLGKSAHAVNFQQVFLAEWAKSNLPRNARLGVNDAGALAYLSERQVVDLIGLVTDREARYSVAGEGSRFEHYEHLRRDTLPTHFIVYPQWVGHPMLFGEQLQRATVTDQSILGGATMFVFPARYETLGSGALPATSPTAQTLVDEVDVSDLDSEAAHDYELGKADYQDNRVDEVVWFRAAPGVDPAEIVRILNAPHPEQHLTQVRTTDAGRRNRGRDRFSLQMPPGPAQLVLRVAAAGPTELQVTVNGISSGSVHIDPGPWQEPTLALAPLPAPGRARIEISATPPAVFASYHYWLYAPQHP